MENRYFSLEINKGSRLTRIFQLLFGFVCALVAVVWTILNISTLKSNAALWITIILLFGFAYYQVMSGLGLAEKFIEISPSAIKLKKNSLFPAHKLSSADMEKVEIFPLNIVFFLRSGKKVILRFGTTFPDVIEPVNESIDSFCSINNIPLELKKEEL
jgi:hypothetical protein